MNEDLRTEVLRMFAEDQAAVQTFLADAEAHRDAFDRRGQAVASPWPYCLLEWEPLSEAPSSVVNVVETVARNVAQLREIVEQHG